MEYDIFNNMTAYTATGVSQTRAFAYDAFGQCVRTTDQDANKKYYITSGADILAEYTDESNTDPDAEYVYGHNGLMALDKTEGAFFFYKDHLGSTRYLNVSDMQRDYFPYGETRVSAGDETDYQYSGKEYDSGIGLHYFGARYYAANIGRWYTPDPAGQGWSPYVYCGNSPLIYVDLDGGEWDWWQFAAGSLGGAVGLLSYRQSKTQGMDGPGAFINSFFVTARTAMAFYAGQEFSQFSNISGSAVSSYASSGGENVSFGFGDYDVSSGKFSWANPFDKKDTVLENFYDILGWAGLYDDLQRFDYYMFTTPEQRAAREAILAEEGIRRGILDPFENSSPQEALPEDDVTSLQKLISHYHSGPHEQSIRYRGGLHWGLDRISGKKGLVKQFHYDAGDAIAFFGLGVIGHGVEILLHGTKYTPNFAPLLRPWLPTAYRYKNAFYSNSY